MGARASVSSRLSTTGNRRLIARMSTETTALNAVLKSSRSTSDTTKLLLHLAESLTELQI